MKGQGSASTMAFSLFFSMGTGGLAALLIWDNRDVYDSLSGPPLSPPFWFAAIVWVIIYLLLGAALNALLCAPTHPDVKKAAFGAWAVLLALHWIHTLVLFNLEWLLLSFVLTVLMIPICATAISLFARANRSAGLLMLPCFVWILCTAYFGLGVCVLN